jgi:hypothetical protein
MKYDDPRYKHYSHGVYEEETFLQQVGPTSDMVTAKALFAKVLFFGVTGL